MTDKTAEIHRLAKRAKGTAKKVTEDTKDALDRSRKAAAEAFEVIKAARERAAKKLD